MHLLPDAIANHQKYALSLRVLKVSKDPFQDGDYAGKRADNVNTELIHYVLFWLLRAELQKLTLGLIFRER